MASTAQDIMGRYGIDQDFAASIESLGNDLGVDPMYLANVMYSESRLDPSMKNKAGSGATGLIQFMPTTASNLGTTTDELSRMTPVEQMEYVRRYFSADNLGAGRLRDLRNDPSQHNVNMAVFLPSMIGKPVDTQIPRKYWRQNGSIRTPADYSRDAEERVNAFVQSNPVDTQTDQMLSEEQPGDTFRPEDDSVLSDTGPVTIDQVEEEPGLDDVLMIEHEEKIRRGEAPIGSKPMEDGGYYTEGEYGFRTNPESEVVADSEVNSLENVATSVGERLKTILGNNEDSEALELNEGGLVESAREGVYSLGSRGAARELRDTVAKELGVYETSEEARSIAKKYRLSEKETDTLRHILGAGLLKYIDRDFAQPLLLGTEVLDKLQVSIQRLMDSDSENIYNRSYYDQSIEEANRDIINYKVGAALSKQYDTKDDFIKSAVKLVKDLGKGKTPVVVDKMPTWFGVVEWELTPKLSTGVVYNPEELKRKGVIYDRKSDAMVSSRTVLYPPIPEPRPENLKKAEGGSVEKKAEFIKKKDDDVPDPPPGATPEEVADDIPAYLSTGEYVLPANVVRYIGLKNITDMHQRALTELQQMEDLDIIENVDKNGYVEEDDDEMDYMEPEEAGVVEIVVAEHHPKGLMAMGFAEGGPVEAMVYVPGVGFVPQSQAATRPSQKKTTEDAQEKTKEGPSGLGGEDTGKSMSEMSPMEQAAFGEALSGPLGGAIEAVSKGVVGSALGLASPLGVEMGYSLATGVPTAAQQAMKSVEDDIAKAKEMYAMSPSDLSAAQSAFSGPVGNAFGATTNQMQAHEAAVAAGHAPTGSQANAAGGYSTTGEFGFSTNKDGDVVGNDPDRNGIPGDQSTEAEAEAEAEAAEAEAAAQAASEAADNLRDGGYVSKKGIMARGYSKGGEVGDPGGGSGEPLEYEPEVIEEEKPTDPYEGYTYVKGIGYVPTSRDTTTDKSVDSTSLALSSIFTPGFLKTIGLMSDPNKEL